MESRGEQLNSTAKALNSRKHSKYCPHCKSVVAYSTYYKHSKKYKDTSDEWTSQHTEVSDPSPAQKRMKMDGKVSVNIDNLKQSKILKSSPIYIIDELSPVDDILPVAGSLSKKRR